MLQNWRYLYQTTPGMAERNYPIGATYGMKSWNGTATNVQTVVTAKISTFITSNPDAKAAKTASTIW